MPNSFQNVLSQLLMLRSQIKLTSYDLSDLHITGEFDNRPGTERFLRIFFCVVTYRTVPGRRCKRSTGYGAWSILHKFSRAIMNICILKFAIIPPKKQFVKIGKTEADSDSDNEKIICSRLQKKSIALVRCILIIHSCPDGHRLI